MKVLLINGSPKVKRSNSLQLANAFVDGLGEAAERQGEKAETQLMDVYSMNIKPCRGCFTCWSKTPGQCVIKDDMAEVIRAQLWADVIIFCFPLYYYNVPGELKNLIDRQLPMAMPEMSERTDGVGKGSHPSRFDMSKKRFVLVSTCGFYTAEGNYDSVTAMFDHMLGKNHFETVFCGQGELFGIPDLRERTGAYLQNVKAAGREYAGGAISENTRKKLRELLLPKETFESGANDSWKN